VDKTAKEVEVQSYDKTHRVNVADRWSERIRTLTEEVSPYYNKIMG
jgi:hypothetical protein